MSTILQNFYKEKVLTAWTAGIGNFYVTTKPVPTSGYLVISPANSSKREIVKYTATGTDIGGDYITISNLSDRGVGGTTAQTHSIDEPVRMNITAEHWADMVADIVAKYGPGSVIPDPTLLTDPVNLYTLQQAILSGALPATTILAGLVEIATQAEYDANTDAGSAAKLVATPAMIRDTKGNDLVTTGGSANTYTITPRIGITAYVHGQRFHIKISATNTTTSTANVNALGAKTIKKINGTTDLTSGDLVIGSHHEIEYDSATDVFMLLTPTANTPQYIAGELALENLKKTFVAGEAISLNDALHFSRYTAPAGKVMMDANGLGAGTSYNISIAANSNRVLIIGVSASSMTGITAGGNAMTLIDSQGTTFVYKLIAPPTGTVAIVITGGTLYGSIYHSFYNASQVTNPEVTAKQAPGGAGGSLSITPLSEMAMIVGYYGTQGYSGSLLSSGVTFGTIAAQGFYQNGNATQFFEGGVSADVINAPASISGAYTYSASGGGSASGQGIVQIVIKPLNAATSGVLRSSAAADAVNGPKTNFVGFATEAVAIGDNISTVISGVKGGHSALTPGATYYLSNTAGQVASSAGTSSKKIGMAVSLTEILIKNENA